jgi:hypothetical protein
MGFATFLKGKRPFFHDTVVGNSSRSREATDIAYILDELHGDQCAMFVNRKLEDHRDKKATEGVALATLNGYVLLLDHQVAFFCLQQGLFHEVFTHFAEAFFFFTDIPDERGLSFSHVPQQKPLQILVSNGYRMVFLMVQM